jgi:hypothetical protein
MKLLNTSSAMRAALCGGAFLASLIAFNSTAQAALLTPEFRGDPNTEYGYWDMFTDVYTPPANIGNVGEGTPAEGGTSGAVIYQIGTATAFPTIDAANIYSTVGALAFELHDTPGFVPEVVLFQFRTLGSEIDYSQISLSAGGDPLAPEAAQEVFRLADIPTGPTTSDQVEYAVQWDLRSHADQFQDDNSYVLSFGALAPHMSFTYASLDVAGEYEQVIPEPSAGALLGVAAILLLSFRRRRRALRG